MSNDRDRKAGSYRRNLLGVTGLVVAAAALLPAAPLLAAGYQLTGASETILRMRPGAEDRELYPLTEYLRMSLSSTQKDGATTSLHLGGWGRVDLGDRSRDGYTDGDLQYGYLGFQGARNNLLINAGRQFVTEGVAAQRLDGAYLRGDLAAGFAAAVFAGAPVITETNLKGDDLIFGGRVSRSDNNRYTVGVSALKSFSGGNSYREEEGIDLWLQPVRQVEISGRSSYNSSTGGWMEHAYTASVSPGDKVRLFADLSRINYRDYFHRATTSAFVFGPVNSGTGSDEKMLAAGGGAVYQVLRDLSVSVDYRHYDYDIARPADYYGAKVSYSIPALGAGLSIHRMDGSSDPLKYTEFRLYGSRRFDKGDLTLDVIDLYYDSAARLNDVRNAVAVVAGGSYRVRDDLQLAASVDYSRNWQFDNEVKGLVKVTYLFDRRTSAEGGAKSEK